MTTRVHRRRQPGRTRRACAHRPLRPLLAAIASLAVAACGGGGGESDGMGDPGRAGGNPPPVVAGPELLVQLAAGADVSTLAAARGLTVTGQFGRRPIWRLQASTGADADRLAQQLRDDPGVVFAEPNVVAETPEGQRGNSLWQIGRSESDYVGQWAPQTMRLASAHAWTTGVGVRVAVLDTGIERSHPAFAGRLAQRADGSLLGYDFVDDDADPSEEGGPGSAGWGHGTHVAGLVALAAPSVAIMPVRVLDRDGRGTAWVLAEALAWAVDPDGDPATDDGAHVINLSLGGLQPTRMLEVATALANCEFDDDDDDNFDHPGFDDDRARCAHGHGAAVLAAAGNGGSADERQYPAAEEVKGTRAVTATTAEQRLADFANFGSWIKLAAPGAQIVSAVPGGAWGTWSGTSMAAPLATGAAALVLTTPAKDPRPGIADPLRRWRAEDLMKRLEDRAKKVCSASVKQIDAFAAVSDTQAPDPACP